MGCFLACFGLSKKRKRRKTLYKVLAAPGHQHYVALDSSVTVNLATPDNSIIPYSNFREQARPKSKKKVSFNLNVQIYEPKPTAYQILESDEEEENNKDNEKMEKSSSSSSILGENSAALNYPSNHRYHNCLDSYNEEDEIEDEAPDIDAHDDEDDEFDDEDGWDYSISDDGEDQDRSEVCNKNPVENQCSELINSSLEEDKVKNHMHSVLRPVENITQWKAIKAQVASSKHRRKENIPLEQKTGMTLLSEPGFNLLESNVSKHLVTEIAVDASLSTWLIPPYASKTTIHCQ
ncbi:protein bfr2-like isoform X2 [Neltuma alba]|uniref:protein bfr2-like isoform X2 n=1 Tax=Neltuma alba TaxID=207710 RepID=UPI0010A4660D|nr:protein bfr2-like isoform X2 [Prosopis alba]